VILNLAAIRFHPVRIERAGQHVSDVAPPLWRLIWAVHSEQ
jgi:hypothetical protein